MTRRLRIADPEQLQWRRVGEEVVILDLRTSTYLALNPAGAILWEALAQGASRDELAGRIEAQFGLAREAALADVDTVLEQLREQRLVEPA